MRKLLALMLCALLLLSLVPPAQAIEIIILDKLLNPKTPTPAPTPTPTPAPDPGTIIGAGSLSLGSGLGYYQTPTPTPTPDPRIITEQNIGLSDAAVAGIIAASATNTPAPATSKPSSGNKAAAATATPKPKGSSAQKGGPQKGAEVTGFGLYAQELRPKLTDQWYMLTPVDLGAEGILSYPLVGQNAHIVGSMMISVQAGALRVDLQPLPGVAITRQLVTFFDNLDDIKTLHPDLLMGQGVRTGENISIADKFGQDRKVLLYVNLLADYDTNGQGIAAFMPDQHRFFMQNLMSLLD